MRKGGLKVRVDVYPTVVNIPDTAELAGRTAVVIDALRATTTIVTALGNGADAVVPMLTPEEAFEAAREHPERRFVLGGERKGVRIPGFDLGNSPLEYTPAQVKGRTVLFTTTNGTRAIRRAAGADRVYVASFLNAPAVAEALVRQGKDVAICCAGSHDQFSLEDTGCAGAILAFLDRSGSRFATNDLGWVALELYRRFEGRLEEIFRLSEHGQLLNRLGMEADLGFCAQLGVSTLVPVYEDGRVILPEAN